VKDLVQVSRAAEAKVVSLPVIKLKEDLSWQVEPTENGFKVTGKKIERFASQTNFSDSHGQQRLRDIMKKMGIMRELNRKGIKAGQKITINGLGSLEY